MIDLAATGGIAANDAPAERAGIRPGDRVADFRAGLGGPARYWAQRFGARVTGIELNPGRVRGATELTTLVGLQDRVRVIEGDVKRTGLPDGSMDVVVSQEAFLHIPDKAAAAAEAFRLLGPGGRLAFTDGSCIALSPPRRPRSCGAGSRRRRCRVPRATASSSSARGSSCALSRT